MTQGPEPHPTKKQLREMTAAQLTAYIANLRQELGWRTHGPVHKIRVKQLEVALKVREWQVANEFAGDT
jgi:hypothetical protein